MAAAISELKSAVEERSERYDEVKQLQGTVQALQLAWAGSDGAVGRELGAPSQVRSHALESLQGEWMLSPLLALRRLLAICTRALTVLRYRGGSVTADGVVADAPAAELAALRAAHAKLLRLLILLDRLRLVPAASLDSPTATASGSTSVDASVGGVGSGSGSGGNGFAVGGSTFESRALADGARPRNYSSPRFALLPPLGRALLGQIFWAGRGDGAVAEVSAALQHGMARSPTRPCRSCARPSTRAAVATSRSSILRC